MQLNRCGNSIIKNDQWYVERNLYTDDASAITGGRFGHTIMGCILDELLLENGLAPEMGSVQTFLREIKLPSGIKSFSVQNSAQGLWSSWLNRSSQAHD